MRRLTVIGLVALIGVLGAVWATAAGAASHPTTTQEAVTVAPGRGTRHTTFTVIYRVPGDEVGPGLGRRYSIGIVGPPRAGCSSLGRGSGASGSTSARKRFRLKPPSHGWCVGTYHGRIELVETPICGPAHACPMFIAILTVGRFSFRVK